MLISDRIAEFIEEMLNSGEGVAELKRNDLAQQLGCVPSQINYVISSRFTPERGYVIESRRGGGGYVRITRRVVDRDVYLMHFLYAVGDAIDAKSAAAYLMNLYENGYVTEREKALLCSAVSAMNTLPENSAARLRADSIRRIILTLMK